jgi:hypothetical protein
MRLVLGRTAALFCALVFVPPIAAQSPYQDLLRRLPVSTNVLVTVDVQGLRQALGVAPGTALTATDLSTLPIAAKQFVLGAQVDLSQRKHLWSIALAQLAQPMTIQNIAKAEGEAVGQVAGYNVVASKRNAYFIDLGDSLLGIGSPANRQQLKRWLNYQKNNQLAALSPYLLQAANSSGPPLILMAVDISDSLDPLAIHRGLNGSKVMASHPNADYAAVAKTLAAAKGLIFTIEAGSPLTGHLTVDFDIDTSAIRDFGKALLIEILQHADLYVPDFDSWEPRPKYQSIGIHGALSINALRKFGTLIRTPVPPPEAASMDSYQSLDPAQRTLAASKRYFQTITQILADLKDDKTRSVKGLAGWYARYADQLDQLPILDVDPILINFEAATSEHLRAMSASLKGISLESGYLQMQKTEGQIYQAPSYTGNYNAYGPYGGYYGGGLANLANNVALYRSGTAGGVTTVNNYAQIYMQQEQLVQQGAAARITLWERIDQETADIRRQLTLKYKTEF